MWNYRVVRTLIPTSSPFMEEDYAIHEVYYNDDGSIWGMTEQPVPIHGENLEDLRVGLEYMMQALERPVLNNEDIEFRTYEVKDDDDNS